MTSDAVTVPVRMDTMMRKISDQWARMSSTLMRARQSLAPARDRRDGLAKL